MKTAKFAPVRFCRTSALIGGIVWLACLLPLSDWLNLPLTSNGVSNALGFVLCGLLAWRLIEQQSANR